jgi:prepilin-type N-terminal cleavage/methylation domain-containing protein/prepilin-type processing-associated H-X9-DG protein
MKRQAFTLIELLVVVAIIGILAAILFPVFARARENARRASCMSNLKQIGLGVMQYTQDYDERYPPKYWGPASGGSQNIQSDPSMPGYLFIQSDSVTNDHFVSWMDLTHPYTKSTQIYVCPSATAKSTLDASYIYASYGYSGGLSGRYRSSYGGDHSGIPASLAELPRPAEIIAFMDYNSQQTLQMNPQSARNYSRQPTTNLYGSTITGAQTVAPHLDGGNIAYADGHVKWQNRSKLQGLADLNTACDLANPNPGYVWCDRAWNPFLN